MRQLFSTLIFIFFFFQITNAQTLALLDAGSVMGATRLCVNATMALSDTVSGGVWSSSNTSVATVDSAGVVTGVAAGSAVISYAVVSGGDTAIAADTITVLSSPIVYGIISARDTFCAGDMDTVVLGNSQGGYGYQLYMGSSAVLYETGKDTALVFIHSADSSGMVTIVATDSATMCTAVMAGGPTVVVNPLPDTFSVTGGGHYCAGGAGEHVFLGGSQAGVFYQLYNDTAAIGLPLAGSHAALDFGLQTLGGLYKVVAMNPVTNCRQPMPDAALVVVNPTPAPYSISGGGPYCATDSGADIWLSNSEAEVKYSLYYNGSLARSITGHGFSVDFGLQTAVGTYSVSAINTVTGCTKDMPGAVSITVNSNPNIYHVTGGGSVLAGEKGVHIGLNGSDAGINYHLYKDKAYAGVVVQGNGMPIDFGIQTGAGTYTVEAFNDGAGCNSMMADSAVITANPQVHVFPNPSGGELTIIIDKGTYTSFTITNAIGQEILLQDLTNAQTILDIRLFAAGMYYMTFRGDNGIAVQKFVKK